MYLSDVYILLNSFRSAFRRARTFNLFVGVMVGFLCSSGDKYLTVLCRSARKALSPMIPRYWSLCKFFSRSGWQSTDLMNCFLAALQREFDTCRIIIDATSTTTQGRRQAWRHYRRNPHYTKSCDNQSKWLAGNSALSIAFVGLQQTLTGLQSFVFPLGAALLKPGSKQYSERRTAIRTVKGLALKPSILIADKLYSDAHTVNSMRGLGHTLITRLQANAAFYAEAACKRRISCDTLDEVALRIDGVKIYRSTMICYRKKLNEPIRIVRDRRYDRRKKRWRIVYYCSTDCSMSANQIATEYKRRTAIEHIHQDAKALTGFNHCRLRSARSIERFLSLSLLAVGLLEWLRYRVQSRRSLTTHQMLEHLDLHWYKPARLTRGLVLLFVKDQIEKASCICADFWSVQNLAMAITLSFFVS